MDCGLCVSATEATAVMPTRFTSQQVRMTRAMDSSAASRPSHPERRVEYLAFRKLSGSYHRWRTLSGFQSVRHSPFGTATPTAPPAKPEGLLMVPPACKTRTCEHTKGAARTFGIPQKE